MTTADASSTIKVDATAAGFTSYVLPNGFKLILANYPSASNVRIELTVKTGSNLEGYGETGMAHLLEHMLFKGAGKRKSIKDDLTRIGARWNADTTADRTSYFEQVSADAEIVDEAIRIEADRFMGARFTKEDLSSEMTVVRNELERNDTNPQSVMMRSILRQSFFWHGYGRPTIGARSDIEDAPFEVLQAFHARHYRPDNAFMIVSGNFNQKRVLALVSELFSKARNPDARKISSWTREQAQAVTNQSELFLPAGVTMAMSAWKIPGSYDRQTISLSLASSAICSEAWGSLRQEIVLKRKAANAAYCFGFDKPEAGLFIASAQGGKDDDAAVLSRNLREFIEKVAQAGITQKQLDRAKEEEVNAFVLVGNAHEVFSRMLSDAEVAGDWRLAYLQHDIARDVTLEEANEALRKWVVPTNRSDVVLRHAEAAPAPALPKMTDPVAQLSGKKWNSVVTRNDPLPQNAAELARATVAVALGDARVQAGLISRKTQGDLAWVVIDNDFGNEEALRGKSLACGIASSLFAYGGAGMSRDQLDAALERLQANWEINMGRILVNAPRKNIAAALDILLPVWANPAMPLAEFERIKARSIAGMESALKDPAALASNEMELRFDNYPEHHPRKVLSIRQELADIRALSFDAVKSCHAGFAGLSHIRMSVVGDFKEQDVREMWEKIGKLPAAKVPYRRIAEMPVPTGVDTTPIKVTRPKTPNASIAGMLLIPVTDADRDFPALRLAVNILGGNTSSRVWNRLREVDGLAYSVGASLAGSSHEPRSVFSMSASAASDKAEIALEKLQEELNIALRDGFTDEEVRRAKKTWAQDRRRYAGEERLFATRLSYGMLNGRDFAWLAAYDERIAAVTTQEVTAALRKHIAPASVVWMIAKGED